MAKRIFLIIDDDSDDQELFIEAVAEVNKSIECIAASDGERALFELKEGILPRPELIFLDLNMPRLNGKQCLVELKKLSGFKEIPVIIYSTSSEKRDVEETIRLGAAHFLTKPNKFEELCRALQNVISSEWAPDLARK